MQLVIMWHLATKKAFRLFQDSCHDKDEEFEEYEREREKQRNILTNIGSFKILVFKYV